MLLVLSIVLDPSESHVQPATALKAMFCSNVLIRKIITTITGRNVLNFNSGESLASVRFNRKEKKVTLHQKGGSSAELPHFGVNLHVQNVFFKVQF